MKRKKILAEIKKIKKKKKIKTITMIKNLVCLKIKVKKM